MDFLLSASKNFHTLNKKFLALKKIMHLTKQNHSAAHANFSMHFLKFCRKVYATLKIFQNLHAASTKKIQKNELKDIQNDS